MEWLKFEVAKERFVHIKVNESVKLTEHLIVMFP